MAKGNRKDTDRRGKAGLPKTGGIRPGDVIGTKRLNTHDIIKALRADVRTLEKKHFNLLERGFEMIADPKVQDFVKKDLILGLLQLITPKMKAVEMDVQMPPTQILFNTNVMPQKVNGESADSLRSIPDLFEVSPEQ